MIRAAHFRNLLVRPVLQRLSLANPKLYSQAAENLLMGTAAQESGLGYNMHQIGGGPALGAFQIEPATFLDIMDRYLKRESNEGIREQVEYFCYRGVKANDPQQLITNLPLGCAVARIRYWMEPDPLPDAFDLGGLAEYWDIHYNANPEHGTEQEFIENYRGFVGDD